ncbi:MULTISPECIES: leucine-rich repeat domain-containing protein [Wolbachia]|uniref:Uncharacterized protein n=2 Tax=Wolbachieae TaxID=952 RepID=A0AAU8MME7_9RICK|nr:MULTISPECIES: hypothetical protein [Wolbachia]CAQ54153.1 Hypothetical protein WP0044 [Wolbachia endosymbiont of Culex quinquefasciatus Pel]MBS9531016.1 hypothetical protein [Wolbachia endosymbiont of Rhagoletis cerasi]PBQ27249.1 hypothetical protein BTO27_03730 [Wolbachia pipientis wAus]QEK90080.1 hypothetical protein CAI20_05515 [Wolbachia endosymbiont of Chrysomya megacephala]UFO00453.1 hypothetical protein LOK48_00420 [Wolbachia endosymbiont of Corcyra cephalonica]
MEVDFNQYVNSNTLELNNLYVYMEKLVNFLQKKQNITSLTLSNCYIDAQCGEVLNEALENINLPNITECKLTSSIIGAEGSIAITKLLKNGNFPNLIKLDLISNDIDVESGIILMSALRGSSFSNIKEFNLLYDNVCNEGIAALRES